jgi:hypothetical protein
MDDEIVSQVSFPFLNEYRTIERSKFGLAMSKGKRAINIVLTFKVIFIIWNFKIL